MKAGVVIFGLFGAIFCALGLGMGYFGIATLIQGDTRRGLLIFDAGLAFGGFGAGALAVLIIAVRSQDREDARRAAHPNEPWRWREDWADGRVKSSTRFKTWFLWGFAFLWNTIAAPITVFLPAEILEKQNYAALLGLLFPLVGVGLLVAAVRASIRQRKFGNCLFWMDHVPGILGGDVSGTILTPRRITAGATIQLSCVNSVRSGSGRNSSTTEHALWQEEVGVQPIPDPGGKGSLLPLRFRVPFDAKPTDAANPDNAILWRLVAQAAVPGVDFKVDFEIPVFLTSASSREATEERMRSEELARVAEPLLLTPESGIAVFPSREGGREFRLSRGQESAGVMPLVAVAAFWTGLVALVIYAGAPLLFSIVFGAFDLILLLIVLYLSFGECRIAVESGELRVRSALLGLRTEIRVPCSGIAKISVTDSSTVAITRKDGKVLYVRWFFKRKQTADWLADEIRKEVAPWRGSPSP